MTLAEIPKNSSEMYKFLNSGYVLDLLGLISKRKTTTSSEISETSGVHLFTVCKYLKKLREYSLVERDRRLYSATEFGSSTYKFLKGNELEKEKQEIDPFEKFAKVNLEKVMRSGEKYNLDALRMSLLKEYKIYKDRESTLKFLDEQEAKGRVTKLPGNYSSWTISDGTGLRERKLTKDYGKQKIIDASEIDNISAKVLQFVKNYGDTFEVDAITKEFSKFAFSKWDRAGALSDLSSLGIISREKFVENGKLRNFYVLNIFEEDVAKLLEAVQS